MPFFRFLSNSDLVSRAREIAREERKLTADLLEHLHEIERREIHVELGHPNLHRFVVKELGYSEGAAHHRISAMRLMNAVPEARAAIEEGTLPLSTASVLQGFFRREECTPETKRELVQQMQGLSRRDCERKLAAMAPAALPAPRPRMHVIAPTPPLEVRLLLTESLQVKIERVRGILGEPGPLEFLLERLVDAKLRDHSHSHSHSHSHKRIEISDVEPTALPGLRRTDSPPGKLPESQEFAKTAATQISASLRRQVWARAKRRCEFPLDDGASCGSRLGLRIELLAPRARGREALLSNLRLACGEHGGRSGSASATLKTLRR